MLVAPGETVDDVRPAQMTQASRLGPMLVVALECDRPIAGSARYFLGDIDVVTFGRGGTRTVVRQEDGSRLEVQLPGRAVSGSHARLVRLGTQWVVEDMGSRNGTFVN